MSQSALQLLGLVVAVSVCVLTLAFGATYFLNKDIDSTNR